MRGAVITAAVAVVVAVITQLETWRRTRSDRVYDRRRSALIDVQDAALRLRNELRSYGRRLERASDTAVPATSAQPDPPGTVLAFGQDSDEADIARGRLEVCAVRLEPTSAGRAASAALDTWATAAGEHFLSAGDRTAGTEQSAWTAFNTAVAAALVA